MKTGLYLRNIKMIENIPQSIMQDIACITCGDYACPKILPKEQEVLSLNESLKGRNKSLHYISPKLSQAYIEDEFKRVINFMNQGIGISVNDWGLLYKIRPHIKQEHDICIGRVLTKSIADWTWNSLLLGGESDRGKNYLYQNNFNHKVKINYFKSWGVKGIEVSINNLSEDSYKSIQAQGMYVIGFVDNTILALARACPASNIKNDGICTELCDCSCNNELYHLVPKKKEQQEAYPNIKVGGKVIYGQRDVVPTWDGYKRIVYTWGIGKS